MCVSINLKVQFANNPHFEPVPSDVIEEITEKRRISTFKDLMETSGHDFVFTGREYPQPLHSGMNLFSNTIYNRVHNVSCIN
jgi:hypothetical protein